MIWYVIGWLASWFLGWLVSRMLKKRPHFLIALPLSLVVGILGVLVYLSPLIYLGVTDPNAPLPPGIKSYLSGSFTLWVLSSYIAYKCIRKINNVASNNLDSEFSQASTAEQQII